MPSISLFDLLVIASLIAVLPVIGTLDWHRFLAQVHLGHCPSRRRLYGQTVCQAWILTLLVVGGHVLAGRPLASIGLTLPDGTGLMWGLVALVLLAGLLIWSLQMVKKAGSDERSRIRHALGPMAAFMPTNHEEKRAWLGLSITTGVTEELVYRGYLLWLLTTLMSLGWAVAVSALIFGLQHVYMGPAGVLRTALLGAALAGLYLLSGSLLLPMIAHALINLLQGLTFAGLVQETSGDSRVSFDRL